MQETKRRKQGFSLSETLVTVLLLVIVLSAVTSGVHAMSDSYFKIRKRADAESLLMTASNVISGDLRNVTAINKDANGNDAFYCESRYSNIQYFNGDGNKGIQVKYLSYSDNDQLEEQSDQPPKPLVTVKTNSDHLYTSLLNDKVDWNNKYFEYTLQVFSTDDNSKPIASQKIIVKPLNGSITSSPGPSATPEN